VRLSETILFASYRLIMASRSSAAFAVLVAVDPVQRKPRSTNCGSAQRCARTKGVRILAPVGATSTASTVRKMHRRTRWRRRAPQYPSPLRCCDRHRLVAGALIRWFDDIELFVFPLTGGFVLLEAQTMESAIQANRQAWESASHKYLREYDDFLAQAAAGTSLLDRERELLADVLIRSPEVVHLQSGNGTDDVALIQAGAKSVVGVDYSEVTVRAARQRAAALGVDCRYVVAALPGAPLASASADLVYTGKGALVWMPDLEAWAQDVVRLLRPSGHLFIYEEHPAAVLWTWDEDEPRIRADRSYFGASHVNDTFPASGAVEWQHTLGEIVTTVAAAGMQIVHLAEYAEPFWRMGGVCAAAWNGHVPNSFALLARLA
jgi:SAM-dependent methyltransferase